MIRHIVPHGGETDNKRDSSMSDNAAAANLQPAISTKAFSEKRKGWHKDRPDAFCFKRVSRKHAFAPGHSFEHPMWPQQFLLAHQKAEEGYLY